MSRARDVRVEVVTPAPVDPDVTITMSGEVARSLRSLLGMVGGDTESTYRADTGPIYRALGEAGVQHELGRFEGSLSGRAIK